MQKIITIDLGGVNSYLIEKNGKFTLVDTGGHMFMDKEYDDRRQLLINQLDEQGVTEANLEMIILTHGDNDHVCNAKYIAELYHAKIAMHPEDVWMVEKKDPESYRVNSNYQSTILRLVFKLMDKKITKLMTKVTEEFETFSPEISLFDGSSLEEYGFDGKIYHCPGHTKGSICIIDQEGNTICGDLFANNGKPSLAVNAEDFKRLETSAHEVLHHGAKKIYPGHGKPFDVEDIKLR